MPGWGGRLQSVNCRARYAVPVSTFRPNHFIHRVIYMEPSAPSKPLEGQPCNGCGVCCLAEPCPLGVLLTGRRTGACDALRWDVAGGLYRCGALSEPQAVLIHRLPEMLSGIAPLAAWGLPRLARRWISAGSGCDCSLEAIAAEANSATTLPP